MALVHQLHKLTPLKFSFAKSTEHARSFAASVEACSMFLVGFGLGIPHHLSPENQLRGIFREVMRQNGVFLFNISGVDLLEADKGFESFEEADEKNQITEWELHQLLTNIDLLEKTIFHNGKTQFNQKLLWKSVR